MRTTPAPKISSSHPTIPANESWPGRKGAPGVLQQLISLMPPHRFYVEPFVGKSPIIRAKRPAELSIGIDIDPRIVQWWTPRASSRMTILQGDARHLASSSPTMRDPNALYYFDPPYLRSTRTRSLYDFELETDDQHAELLTSLTNARAMIMISGYPSALYDRLLKGWRTHTFNATTRGGSRVEKVWMNYAPPSSLHDCRHVGTDFRERQRIKRKRQRWLARFQLMDTAERQVIKEALDLAASSETTLPPAPSSPMTLRSAASFLTMLEQSLRPQLF